MFFTHKSPGNGVKKLPRLIRAHMERKFDLLPEYLDMLRCFEYDTVAKGQQVRCIRIFSPDRAREYHLSIKTSPDLEQHPEVLFFEGCIDSSGTVYLADRRVMSYPEGVVRQRS